MSAPATSNERPIPLCARRDVHAHQTTYLGQKCWVIKDPLKLNYFRLEPIQYTVLQLLDGQKNIEQVRNALRKKFPMEERPTGQIQQIILDLYQKGLAWSTRPGQGESLNQRGEDQKWQKIKQTLRNVLFIRLPGFDPTRTLEKSYWFAKWIFHPGVMIWAVTMILFSWIFMATHATELAQRLPSIASLTTWECTLMLWVVIGITKIIHELGHAFACRHSGGECHEIGMAFLVFSPCLYCDVSDSWTLRSKWNRIGIALAGVYVELLMASLCFFGWWTSQPGTIHQVCFLTFVVSSISTLLFNLNPLLRLDGYYILSDWLEIPNLRQKADKALENAFLRIGLGIKVESEPIPSKTKSFFIIYAIASTIYRSFLVVVICCILYSALKPFRLEFLGLMVGVLSAVLGMTTWVKRIRTAIKKHANARPQSQLQPLVSTVLATCFLVFVLFVPIPISLKAPLRLELADARRVFAGSDGQLVAVHVQPGQIVQPGQLLLELFDFEDMQRLNQLMTEKQVQEIELRKQKILVDPEQTAIAMKTLQSLETEIDNHVERLQRLIVRAPVGGEVVEPPIKTVAGQRKHELPAWSGTPIDGFNVGCQLVKGTHLLTVAPKHEFQAILVVDQLDVHAIEPGQSVRLKLKHLPGQTFVGTVDRVSAATMEADAGNEADANMTAVNNYHAIVTIAGNQRLFLPGGSGQAKVKIESKTAAQWIWRNVKSTFNFQI